MGCVLFGNELESLYKTAKPIIEQITGPVNDIFHKNVVIYECICIFVARWHGA